MWIFGPDHFYCNCLWDRLHIHCPGHALLLGNWATFPLKTRGHYGYATLFSALLFSPCAHLAPTHQVHFSNIFVCMGAFILIGTNIIILTFVPSHQVFFFFPFSTSYLKTPFLLCFIFYLCIFSPRVFTHDLGYLDLCRSASGLFSIITNKFCILKS